MQNWLTLEIDYHLLVSFSLVFNFAEGLCWARTADRQTSQMRVEYLKSVLRQDVGFFDTQAADSSITFQVVSTISSDSSTIQIAIGEKVLTILFFYTKIRY